MSFQTGDLIKSLKTGEEYIIVDADCGIYDVWFEIVDKYGERNLVGQLFTHLTCIKID